jgi:thioredoxin reductase
MSADSRPTLTPDVLVIGAGPAGLTAAAQLARQLTGEVLVLDREAQAGGIPRHSNHPGYGIRDLHRLMNGPAYAERLVEAAQNAGATVRTQAMVTGWAGELAEVTTPQGRLLVKARAILLATGARERPRAARLIPGDRPAGVFTSGQLQNLVHLRQGVPGRRAVIVGAELVSWSDVVTLREAGCGTVLMMTEQPIPESYKAFCIVGRLVFKTPVATRTRLVRIIGRDRVEAVEVEDLRTGARVIVDCDTVIFSGDWIPDNELARRAGISIDRRSRAPVVDAALRTSRSGIFAAGNLVHPVETADIAALGGRHVAIEIAAWLDGVRPLDPAVRLVPAAPLRWLSPGLLRAGDPAPTRGRLVAWTSELVSSPLVTVTQRGQVLALRRIPWAASPGRAFRIPSTLFADVVLGAGDVTVSIS